MKVAESLETNKHAVMDILQESLEFEKLALLKYTELLPLCSENVALEEMVRGLIREEQEHIDEVEKMLRPSPS